MATGAALNRVGDRGHGEEQRLSRLPCAVHRNQRSALIGIESLASVYLCLRTIDERITVQVRLTIGSRRRLRLGQLHGVGQLNGCKVGNVLVDRPGECLGVRYISNGVLIFTVTLLVTKVHRIRVRSILNSLDLLCSDLQGKGIHTTERKLLSDGIDNGGTGTDSVNHFVLNLRKSKDLSFVQIIHKGTGIIGIPCTCRIIFDSNGKQMISARFHFLPSLISVIECHVAVVGSPWLTGLRFEISAGDSLVKVIVILAVIIVIITGFILTVYRFISCFHIIQICLPSSNIRCL